MKAQSSPMSVGDYCNDLNQDRIHVNDDYQRQEGLWTAPAKSYFVESIILEYPIPKLFLYARLDLKTRTTIKEIVDGQQRSRALQDFYNDKLRLSKKLETVELRGKKYSELDDSFQTQFLTYSLPIDQFSGVPEDDVQEAFRRMNANNVPLNAEEQRNARFQGPFKWLIINIAKEFRAGLTLLGLFSKRDSLRMADLRNYAEIVYAIDIGFDTTKGEQLDRLYKKYNSEADFALEDQYTIFLREGVTAFMTSRHFQAEQFLRGHVFQSIVLALIDREFNCGLIQKAEAVAPAAKSQLENHRYTIDNLRDALADKGAFPALSGFVDACTVKTNVGNAKAARFLYFRNALG